MFPYPDLAVFGYTSYIFGEKELECFQGGTWPWAAADARTLCFINVCISPIAPDMHAISTHMRTRPPSTTIHDYSGTISRPIGGNPADGGGGNLCPWNLGGMSTETTACDRHGFSLGRLDCRALVPSPVKPLRHQVLPPLSYISL